MQEKSDAAYKINTGGCHNRMMTTLPASIPKEPSARATLNHALPYLLLFIGIIAGIVLEAIFLSEPSRWIGHSVTGTAGLVLLIMVIVTGAIRSGRLQSLTFRQVHFTHKIASVAFSGIAVGTFFLGLLVMVGHGEPVMTTVHGWTGLIVAALSTVQLLPSLFITRRQSIRKIHMIIGFLIVPLFLLQVFLGLNAAELLEAGYD
jgi:hypothetical protein